MRQIAIVALYFILSACMTLQPSQQYAWQWVGGGDPSYEERQVMGRRDIAQCDYEMQQMAIMAPRRPYYGAGGYNDPQMGVAMSAFGGAMMRGPGPAVFEKCMNARGWILVTDGWLPR